MASQREPELSVTVLGSGTRGTFVRWQPRGNKEDTIELVFLKGRFRDKQVTVMNRIERPSEESYSHGSTLLTMRPERSRRAH